MVGSNLIVTGRRKPRLHKLKEDIEKAFPGVSVHPLQLDMQDAAAVTALPGTLPDAFQAIDILVNNAGKALGVAPVSPPHTHTTPSPPPPSLPTLTLRKPSRTTRALLREARAFFLAGFL
jgi:NAD(P)-dependent dehydrogenase (short-subunit alcohol dehydrogenase family)